MHQGYYGTSTVVLRGVYFEGPATHQCLVLIVCRSYYRRRKQSHVLYCTCTSTLRWLLALCILIRMYQVLLSYVICIWYIQHCAQKVVAESWYGTTRTSTGHRIHATATRTEHNTRSTNYWTDLLLSEPTWSMKAASSSFLIVRGRMSPLTSNGRQFCSSFRVPESLPRFS